MKKGQQSVRRYLVNFTMPELLTLRHLLGCELDKAATSDKFYKSTTELYNKIDTMVAKADPAGYKALSFAPETEEGT